MNSKTVSFGIAVFVFCFLQNSCGQISTQDDLKMRLDNIMARTYERIDLINYFIDTYKNQGRQIVGDENIVYYNIVFHRITQLVGAIQNYYDDLKENSFLSKQLPDMTRYMLEIVFLNTAPTYTNLMYQDIADYIQSPESPFEQKEKIILVNELRPVVSLFNNLFIEDLKEEILANPHEWEDIDLVRMIVVPTETEIPKRKVAARHIEQLFDEFAHKSSRHFEKIDKILHKEKKVLSKEEFGPKK